MEKKTQNLDLDLVKFNCISDLLGHGAVNSWMERLEIKKDI